MPNKKIDKQIECISIRDFYESFGVKLGLKLVGDGKDLAKMIREKSINRPALALTGYLKFFAYKRLQLFGAGEMSYLRDLKESEQEKVLTQMAQKKIPCMVVSRNLSPTKAMIRVSKKFEIPLLCTHLTTKDFSADATLMLENWMAPQISLHGTLLDIKGIGTLLRGSSGAGKSECALALVERGHSLIADDLVYVKLLAERTLMGTGSSLNRGYMECRGLGIINVVEIFGIGAIRLEKRIDLVITFREWTPGMQEERTGLEAHYFKIFHKEVPHVEIPVRPGRDLARLVEVAAMVQALKNMGHDSADTFNRKLIDFMVKKLK